jgi:16S rRNA (guanine527-N7)-methyltransferase
MANVEDELAALGERFRLDDRRLDQLHRLLRIVATDPLAPTTVRDPRAVLRDHMADSLVALDVPAARTAQVIADIGSGPGFPGLALAIARPEASVTLVEASARKCEFIARTARECASGNVSVVNARAESWRDGLESADLVTARALAPLEVVAEYAAPLLRLGGTLVAWRGRREAVAETAAAVAASELGLEPTEILHVEPYPGAANRHLHLFLKVRRTPGRFPRRPGVARKRPLGAGATTSDR